MSFINQPLASPTNRLRLQEGDYNPFALPNQDGKLVFPEHLLFEGPLVLFFFRGTWCSHSMHRLLDFQKVLRHVWNQNGNVLAISPQLPSACRGIKKKYWLQFDLLFDPGNEVARQYVTVCKNEVASIKKLSRDSIDFYSYYSDRSGELPVQATFVINRNGVIKFAKPESSAARCPLEPREIIGALTKL